jgi:hypothetical protein
MISHKLALTSVTATKVFSIEGKQIALSLTTVKLDFPVIATKCILTGL